MCRVGAHIARPPCSCHKNGVRGRSPSGPITARLSCCLAAAACTLCAAPAAAAAELALAEPASCTTRDELSFRVERLLGQPLAQVEAMQLSVRIEPSRAGYDARLHVSRPADVAPGTRALHAASCAELTEALALAIVVAIGADPEPSLPAGPAPTPPDPPALPEAEPVAPTDKPTAAPTTGPAWFGAAWMVADTGTLPAPGLGVALGVGLSWPDVQLRVVGTVLPEREGFLQLADASPPGASIGLLAGSVAACVPFAVKSSALGLSACAGWELGQLSGSGTHISTPFHQRRFWSAPRFDVAGRWALSETALALEMLVTAAAPLTRDDFVVEGLGSVHRPANVVGRLGLGLSVSTD